MKKFFKPEILILKTDWKKLSQELLILIPQKFYWRRIFTGTKSVKNSLKSSIFAR